MPRSCLAWLCIALALSLAPGPAPASHFGFNHGQFRDCEELRRHLEAKLAHRGALLARTVPGSPAWSPLIAEARMIERHLALIASRHYATAPDPAAGRASACTLRYGPPGRS